jgi:hypothetical protein
VGHHTGVTFAFRAVAGVGFGVPLAAGLESAPLAADLESVAGGGAAVAAGLLEHAAQPPRSIAMAKRVFISGLPF